MATLPEPKVDIWKRLHEWLAKKGVPSWAASMVVPEDTRSAIESALMPTVGMTTGEFEDALYQIIKNTNMSPYIRMGARNVIEEAERGGIPRHVIDMIKEISLRHYPGSGGGVFIPEGPVTPGLQTYRQLLKEGRLFTSEGIPTVGQLDIPARIYIDPKTAGWDATNIIGHEVGHALTAYDPSMPEHVVLSNLYKKYTPAQVLQAMIDAAKGSAQEYFLESVRPHYMSPAEQLAQLFANRASGARMYLEPTSLTAAQEKALREYFSTFRLDPKSGLYIPPSPTEIPELSSWYHYISRRAK